MTQSRLMPPIAPPGNYERGPAAAHPPAPTLPSTGTRIRGSGVSRGQLTALSRVAVRELAWGLSACASELQRWRCRAQAIPDGSLRADALCGLTRKRPHLDGAALFATLPRNRNRDLLRALVTYQTILEYLDGVNERAAHAGVRNGQQLHLALRDALDPDRTAAVDYYRHNPARQDGGYLHQLVRACQQACAALPAYAAVRAHLLRYARSLQVLALNHEPDGLRRQRRLRQWAARERPGRRGERWHELAGEATGSLAIHGLLALAAREHVQRHEIEQALAVYPRLGLLATMLDSYVDQARDRQHGSHSYIAYYEADEMIERLVSLIGECFADAPALPGGQRNTVLLACMIAMYLSSDGAHSSSMRIGTRTLAASGGALTRALMPVLRAWRLAYELPGA